MLIVGSGGSSRVDWICLLPDKSIQTIETRGLNPYFLSEKEIIKVLNSVKLFQEYSSIAKEIHFFGAGCNSPDKREIVSNALSVKFKQAFINVESDLLGGAFATCGNKPGLNCILGTGSNISYFDGEKLFEGSYGLGYILGDEGSGSFFGKKLITDFLYEKMPPELSKTFKIRYHTNKELVIEQLYKKPLPNYYLASHTDFLANNLDHPYCIDIIKKGLSDYIQTHVCSYENHKELYCHFIGPIAFKFETILREVCKEYQIHVGKIIEKSAEDLFKYVREKEGF
jgi:glucosamine kinase